MSFQLPDYVTPEYLAALKLCGGLGKGEEDGDRCVIQWTRSLEGLDPRRDTIPDTDSPVIGRLLIALNDASDVWRAKLPPYGLRFIGSRGSNALEERRALRLFDWTLREVLPDAIDAAAAICDGETTRELSRIAAELRAAKPVAALAARAALADLAALAARAALADLADLADLAALAALAARAARADLADLAALAALAARAARADLAADRASEDEKIWTRIAALLDELLGMQDPAAAATP